MDHSSSTEILQTNYIFQENEFESESFECSSFVVKYQKVISMDMLKRDLQGFMETLRQQLYDTVNRDYKDFIHIAMKLEGVDVRLSLIKTPMSSLRTDVNALYDALVSTLSVIQTAIRNKKSINDKKQFLTTALECLRKLSIVESVLSSSSEAASSRRSQLQAVMAKVKASDSARDVFLCSEIERAAYELAQAEFSLSCSELEGEEESVQRLRTARRQLQERAASLRARLLARATERLTEILHTGIAAHGQQAAGLFSSRSLLHLLRALVSLGKGELCEHIVAERLVNPLLRNTLTPGRVDGADGRGSFSGLAATLHALVRDVSTRLAAVIQVCEAERIPIDLALHGVWLPAMTFLDARFNAIFSSGIANTFHACYSAIQQFSTDCAALAGVHSAAVSRRLAAAPAVKAFHDKWKLDLYLQIRTQESFARIDTYCAAAAVLPAISAEFPSSLSVAQSLPAAELAVLRATLVLRLPILAVFATEVAACLHPLVFLSALGPKLLLLGVRLLARLELHLAAVLRRPTPSVNEALLDRLLAQTDAEVKSRVTVRDLISLVDDLHRLCVWLDGALTLEATHKLQVAGHSVALILSQQTTKLLAVKTIAWEETCRTLTAECKENLQSVKAVASKFRMTNKPPPTAPSAYVETVLAPLKRFLAQFADIMPEEAALWIPALLVVVTDSYLQQVQALMETVRQMDTALQRRSKLRINKDAQTPANPTAIMSDSDKITLQLLLDAKAYGRELTELNMTPPDSFNGLLEELADAERFLASAT